MLFAGIGFGFHKAAKEQKRLEQGIAIKRMLYLLQGEIRYGFTPLPEAVLKISTKTEKEYQPFLKKVAKQLETHSEESFAKIWQQTADQKLKQVIYEPKFYEILKNMGETIGYLDQQMHSSLTVELQGIRLQRWVQDWLMTYFHINQISLSCKVVQMIS